MTAIHDRMLAVLDFNDGEKFLRGVTLPFTSYAGEIIAEECESPLKRKTTSKNENTESELF